MESNPVYITVTEAARILDVEADRVYELLDDHAIRGKREGNTTYVRQEDIAEVLRMNMIGIRLPELVHRHVILERTVERLQIAVDKLYEVNNLVSSRFSPMTEKELLELYGNIVDHLKDEEWTLPRMLQLCEVFIKLTEIEVDQINEALSIDNSWLPFYRLALRMTRFVGTQDDLESNYDLQKVRDLLHVSRRNLQTIAILFINQKAALGPSRELLAKMAATDIEAFDILIREIAKGKKAG
jgi:excisionase family DNA binding protein